MRSRREVEDSFEAVPAYIVADKRDRLGRRLGRAAFIMLALFFIISSYIQSAKNGIELDESRRQRQSLIESQERITLALNGQGALIVALQDVITRQNIALRKAGLPVEPVPNLQDLIDQAMGRNSSDAARPTPSSTTPSGRRNPPQPYRTTPPSPTPRPNSTPKPKPSSSPEPKPSPSPTRDSATQLVCDLTGVCLQNRSTNAEPRTRPSR